MIRIYILLVVSAFGILFTSCRKDWFDLKSDKNITVLTTLQDFELLLDDYNRVTLSSPALGEVASDIHYTPDSRWITLADITAFIPQKNAYIWNKVNRNIEVLDWNVPYKLIFYCNLVLEGLEKIERNGSNMIQYDRVRGNALFHRARAYFELSQVFTPPFEPEKDNIYGLPFRESTDVSEKLKRKTVHETFLRIENDLKAASEIVPSRSSPLTRASKAACFGLLSRVYLVTGRFEDALFYANKTLEIDDDLVDFNKVISGESKLGMFNEEVIFHSELIPLLLIYHPRSCFIEQGFVDDYDQNDLRKDIYFNYGSSGITFKAMYTNSIVQFSGLATDEIYLIKAESHVRKGQLAEGMSVLNSLLRERYRRNSDGSSTLIDRNASTMEEALRIILAERKRELLLRGLRWLDLRRLNRDPLFSTKLERTVLGRTYILLPNSQKYALPIPDDEISISAIPQNPGWDD